MKITVTKIENFKKTYFNGTDWVEFEYKDPIYFFSLENTGKGKENDDSRYAEISASK